MFTASFPHTRAEDAELLDSTGTRRTNGSRLNNLTLNFGLRYDLQYRSFNNQLDLAGRESLSQFIDPDSRGDYNNYGPRVGFAWDHEGQRADRRAWCLRSLLPVPAAGFAPGRADHAAAERHQHHESVLSGPLRRICRRRRSSRCRRDRTSPSSTTTSRTRRATRRRWASRSSCVTNLALHVDGVYTNLRGISRTQNINQPLPLFDPRTLTAAAGRDDQRVHGRAAQCPAPAGATGATSPSSPRTGGTTIVRSTCGSTSASPTRTSTCCRIRASGRRTTSGTSPTTTTRSTEGAVGPEAHVRGERLRTAAARAHVRRGLDAALGAAVRCQQRRRSDGRRRGHRVPGVTRNMGGRDDGGHGAPARAGQRVAGGERYGGDSREPARKQQLQPGRLPLEQVVLGGSGTRRRSERAGASTCSAATT